LSARLLLDQLLQSGQGLLQNVSRGQPGQGGSSAPQGGQAGHGGLGNLGDLGGALGSLGNSLGGLGTLGTLGGAGALGLLLGSKKARKIGGKVAMYGGMAALGALAYRAYGDWQRKQAAQQPGAPAALPEPQTLDRLPPAQVEQHSSAVLSAMIGAAKADGHIGPDERQLLETELLRLSADTGDRAWLEAELARPLDPAAVAQAATTPEMAAEMYLASLLMVDEESYMERAYLDELARQLRLPADLKRQLETQAQQAQAAA